jgi:hypothetical protein
LTIKNIKGYNDGMKRWTSIDRIVSSRTFKTLLVPFFMAFTLFFVQPANAQKAANTTYLLIGTIGGMSLSGAVFQDSTGEQFFYRLYDKLPDGSQIVKLRDDSVSLKDENGVVYDMFTSHDKKTASSEARISSKSYALDSIPTRHTLTQAERESLERQRLRQLQKLEDRRRAKELEE